MDKSPPPGSESQASRRTKYGLNVLVATVAALGLVILINWIGARNYVRWDLTSERRYSLSPQTMQLLDGLEADYRIITHLPPTESLHPDLADIIRQTIDLADEYERRCDRITVDHFDQGIDTEKLEAFYESVFERHEDDLAVTRRVVQEGRTALKDLGARANILQPMLQELVKVTPRTTELAMVVEYVASGVSLLGRDLADQEKEIDRQLDGFLPNYKGARSILTGSLDRISTRLLQPGLTQFRQSSSDETVPAPVREIMLQLAEPLEELDKMATGAKTNIESAEEAEAYHEVLSRLATPDSVIVVGPDDIQVIGYADLFRQSDERPGQGDERLPVSFQGEEKMTGTLINMSLETPPLVVFVNRGQQPAIGRGGTYQRVARQLQNVNFDVQEWNPTMRTDPRTRQPMPPGPRPEPEAGQNAVWIVLPGPPPNPQNPMAQQAGGQITSAVQERLDAGDGVMLLTGYNPMAFMMGGNETAKLFEPFGIKAETDKAIVTEVRRPNHQVGVHASYDIRRWSDNSPITKALGGMPGHFQLPSPLNISDPGDDVTVTPLVLVTEQRTWAATDLQSTALEYDANAASNRFVVAATAERGDTRVAVFTSSHDANMQLINWASDRAVTMSPAGAGGAHIFGASWPANPELFVNTVFWLADLDNLIAASARTQDVRRVGDMTDSALVSLRWFVIAGMPAACLAIGVGVWWVRRAA